MENKQHPMPVLTEQQRKELILDCQVTLDTRPENSLDWLIASSLLACLTAEPKAYSDIEELAFDCNTSDMWQKPFGFGRDIALYTLPPVPNDRLEWLESMHTLHFAVDILYVVDGYQLQLTRDDSDVGEPVRGATLAEAIDAAIAAGWSTDRK